GPAFSERGRDCSSYAAGHRIRVGGPARRRPPWRFLLRREPHRPRGGRGARDHGGGRRARRCGRLHRNRMDTAADRRQRLPAAEGACGLRDDRGMLRGPAWCVRRVPTWGGCVMTQTVVPMIAYENGPAAMDWLVSAFGFSEVDRRVEDGRLTHGELDTGGGVV